VISCFSQFTVSDEAYAEKKLLQHTFGAKLHWKLPAMSRESKGINMQRVFAVTNTLYLWLSENKIQTTHTFAFYKIEGLFNIWSTFNFGLTCVRCGVHLIRSLTPHCDFTWWKLEIRCMVL